MKYRCQCGEVFDNESEAEEHLLDEHEDWCDDALQEYHTEAMKDVFDQRITEVE